MLGISALIDLLRDRSEKRPALTSLDGCTYYTATNATVTVSTTPANGVRIAVCSAVPIAAGTVQLALNAGSAIFMGGQNSTNTTAHHLVKDLKTPDGVTVTISSSGAGGQISAYAEDL